MPIVPVEGVQPRAGQARLMSSGGHRITPAGSGSRALPPNNDGCQDAESVGDLTNRPFDTTEATPDGPSACMDSPNIWYCYSAPCTGQALISLCGSGFDTKLAVYDGCGCDPIGTMLACNDDNGPGCSGTQSSVEIDVAAGGAYLIEVGGWGSHTGTGLLTISCENINDDCVDARLINVPSNVAGSTALALPDAAPDCDTPTTAPGVWYRVSGTGRTMTAATCNPDTDFDTRISVYCGGCGALTCVAGNDDGPGPECELPSGVPARSRVQWCSQAGAEYLILVHGAPGATGHFLLEVFDDGLPCGGAADCGGESIGACCAGADYRCSETTQSDCGALGGEYLGDGVACADQPCCPPPPEPLDPGPPDGSPDAPLDSLLTWSVETSSESPTEVLVYTGNNGLDEGYANLADALANIGKTATVTTVFPEDLTDLCTVYLSVNKDPFNAGQTLALVTYVHNGGVLAGLGDWSDWAGPANEVMNSLAFALGSSMTIAPDAIDADCRSTNNIHAHAFTDGVASLRFGYTSTLVIGDGALLAETDLSVAPMLAVEDLGNGHFVLSSDSNVFSDEGFPGPCPWGPGNAQLVRNLSAGRVVCPMTYAVRLSPVNPPQHEVCAGLPEPACDPGPLEFGITYYWRVVVNDCCGQEMLGPIWSFTAGGVCRCGDLDRDGEVGLTDFVTFAHCYGLTEPTPDCSAGELHCADLNRDGETGLDDFSTFAKLYGQSGAGSPPDCLP